MPALSSNGTTSLGFSKPSSACRDRRNTDRFSRRVKPPAHEPQGIPLVFASPNIAGRLVRRPTVRAFPKGQFQPQGDVGCDTRFTVDQFGERLVRDIEGRRGVLDRETDRLEPQIPQQLPQMGPIACTLGELP